MTVFVLAIVFTLGVSACCSLLEAFVLSTTTADVEHLGKTSPVRGQLLEKFKMSIDQTSSAILTLNTIANTAGAAWVGALATQLFGHYIVGIVMGSLTFGILIFSEIIPKNLGVVYRRPLAPFLVYPLCFVRITMFPLSFIAKFAVRPLLPVEEDDSREREDEIKEQEIALLAEKHAKDGALSKTESDLISNTLELDNILVRTVMTPRTVVTFLEKDQTVEEVSQGFRNIPFARIPVYSETIDSIAGIVRRRDILGARANDEEFRKIGELMGQAVFIPDTASLSAALQTFMKGRQQLAIVVDEYGSTAGVIAMEDIVEHILGGEIYEDDDVAVDMRELAKDRAREADDMAASVPATLENERQREAAISDARSVASEG